MSPRSVPGPTWRFRWAGEAFQGGEAPRKHAPMSELARFANWFPPLIVGLTFTLMGGLKLYGYVRGVVGGRDKPAFQYLCGT